MERRIRGFRSATACAREVFEIERGNSSHVYNLRASKTYVAKRTVWAKTRANGQHRVACGARPAGNAGAPACGHGPPGRPGRRQGSVSDQFRSRNTGFPVPPAQIRSTLMHPAPASSDGKGQTTRITRAAGGTMCIC